jgi:hypothetical protein
MKVSLWVDERPQKLQFVLILLLFDLLAMADFLKPVLSYNPYFTSANGAEQVNYCPRGLHVRSSVGRWCVLTA